MRISQKLDYASRALVYLARQYDGESVVRADAIAESEAIPPSFLAQILNELKRSGMVTSRRGKTGGWRLTHQPKEISLLRVVEAVEPEALGDPTHSSGPVRKVWQKIGESTRQVLSTTTLDSLAGEEAPMFYI